MHARVISKSYPSYALIMPNSRDVLAAEQWVARDIHVSLYSVGLHENLPIVLQPLLQGANERKIFC